MKKRNTWISLVILLLAAGFIGYKMWNKPHKDVRSADALPVTAVQLYQAFTTDSVKARQLYTSQVVAVSGTIIRISENGQQQQVILLKTATGGASVNCTMEEKSAKLSEGQAATIKGICSGYIEGDADMGLPGDVFLVRCYYVPENHK